MAQIEGLEFEVKGSADKATTALDKLSQTLSSLKTATAGGLGLSGISGNLKKISTAIKGLDVGKVKGLSSAMKELGKAKASKGSSQSDAISEQSHKMRDLYDTAMSMRSLWSDLAGAAKLYAENGVISVNALQRRLETFNPFKYAAATVFQPLTKGLAFVEDQLDKSGVSFRDLVSAERAATDNATPFVYALESMKLGFYGILSAAGKVASGIGKGFVGALKIAGRGIWSVVKGVAKLGASIVRIGIKFGKMSLTGLSTPFVKAFSPVSRFASKLKEVASSFKRVLFYRVVRSVIKEIGQAFREGTQNLYQWSRAFGGAANADGLTFAQTMDDIATSLLYLKNGIGAAVAPLYNLLRPALESVTNAAVELLNVVNQLVARLTGQSTWNKAIRKATEYGDAVGGAGGKAKEALRYLAPFDELNVLPDDKNRGGGGASGDDYGGMFEEMEAFEDGISDFADRVKAAIESSNWSGLGTLLGEKVNEIIDKINFSDAGTKVGEKINALFTTEYWTLKSINFQNIGKKVAEFLTGEDGIGGALREIDFSSLGGTLAQKLTWVYEFAAGAINNFDFSVAGKNLGDLFRGFYDNVSETIESIDWKETVHNFVQGFVDTIKGFDITGALNSVGNLFSKMAGAVNQVDWGEAVHTLIAGLIDALSKVELTGLVNGALELAGAVIGGVIDGLGTLLVDIAEVITDPNTWKLVAAWMQDIPAKVNQFGIDVVNKFVAPIVDGINKLIESYNGSALAEMFGTIPPISFNLIPDIPESELTKNYDAAKKQLEEESRAKKAQLSATANYVSSSNKLTPAQRTIPAFAEYLSVKSKLTAGQRTIPAFANFESSNDRLNEAQRTFSSTAAFNVSKNGSKWNAESTTWSATAAFNTSKNGSKWNADSTTWSATAAFNTSKNGSNWTAADTTWNATAQFTKSVNGSNWTAAMTTWNSTANFNKVTAAAALKDNGGNMVVSAKLKVVGQSGTPTINANITPNVSVAEFKAGGGVFSGGAWHNIPQYAGGTTRAGSIFIAGEAGPEVVGHIGGRTEVLNRSQLAATMYSAVRSAMVGISLRVAGATATTATPEADTEDMMYRAFSRALADSDFGDIELDGDVVYKKMVSRNNANTRLTGVNAFA